MTTLPRRTLLTMAALGGSALATGAAAPAWAATPTGTANADPE
ncbi:hypothetical protein [Actinoplanes sp. ATCC 53533]|nr:hypothetical protein [Actinoplanes sp. ATCC 53533]